MPVPGRKRRLGAVAGLAADMFSIVVCERPVRLDFCLLCVLTYLSDKNIAALFKLACE
jgi:hypothetical protein